MKMKKLISVIAISLLSFAFNAIAEELAIGQAVTPLEMSDIKGADLGHLQERDLDSIIIVLDVDQEKLYHTGDRRPLIEVPVENEPAEPANPDEPINPDALDDLDDLSPEDLAKILGEDHPDKIRQGPNPDTQINWDFIGGEHSNAAHRM